MVVTTRAVLRYFIMVFLIAYCSANLALAETSVSGIINIDQTWTKQNGPFVIDANVTVAENVTLTVEPGVLVEFSGPYWIKVEGVLLAQGSADEPITFTGINADTYWHRLELLPGSDASILDYVTLSNAGTASDAGSQAYGALYIAGSSPQLSHLLIRDNRVTGLFAENIATDLSITDSQFTNNINNTIAGIGAGGVFIESAATATITIRNNEISGNRTNSHGGGLYIYGAGAISVSDNQIADNYAESNLGFGGGVYLANLGGDTTQNNVMNNTIANNTADKDGGGIWMDESQITLSDNVLHANMALDSQGGAVYIGDVDTLDAIQSASNIQKNLVYDNYALELGGAFYIENGSHTVANNVFFGNTADDNGGAIVNEQGGAVILRLGVINFNNNVVAENAASNGGAISLIGSGNVFNNSFAHNTSRHILRLAGNFTVHGNTLVDNVGELSILFVPPQLDPIPAVNNNNFFYGNTNEAMAYLVDNLNQTLLNAQSNWWGTADENEIMQRVSATVDYSGYTLEPLTDTPLAPPKISDFSFTEDSATLAWESLGESDAAGYKVYWGKNPAPDWDNVLDSKAITDIEITGLLPDEGYYFAITVYDNEMGSDVEQTVVNEDQLSGHESWYSRPVYKSAATMPNDPGGSGGGGGLSVLLCGVCLLAATGRFMANSTNNIQKTVE